MKKRMFASRYILWILASGFLRVLYYTSLTVKDFVGTEKEEKGPLLAGAGKVCKKALWSKGLFNRKGRYMKFTTKELDRDNLIQSYTVVFSRPNKLSLAKF